MWTSNRRTHTTGSPCLKNVNNTSNCRRISLNLILSLKQEVHQKCGIFEFYNLVCSFQNDSMIVSLKYYNVIFQGYPNSRGSLHHELNKLHSLFAIFNWILHTRNNQVFWPTLLTGMTTYGKIPVTSGINPIMRQKYWPRPLNFHNNLQKLAYESAQ